MYTCLMSEPQCAILSCPRSATVRGHCRNHYIRERGRGRIPKLDRPAAIERFRNSYKVDPETGCHIWQGSLNRGGYGLFWADGKTVSAHRWIYKKVVGPVDDTLHLDHFKCDRPACVNPLHVRPATARENVLRGATIQAANLAKTRCPHGHRYDEINTVYRKDGSRRCRACWRKQPK